MAHVREQQIQSLSSSLSMCAHGRRSYFKTYAKCIHYSWPTFVAYLSTHTVS